MAQSERWRCLIAGQIGLHGRMGAIGVGKTCLGERFRSGGFTDIRCDEDAWEKQMQVDGEGAKLEIIEYRQNEAYTAMNDLYRKYCAGVVLLVVDYTQPDSMEFVRDFVIKYERAREQLEWPISSRILIMTKMDIDCQRQPGPKITRDTALAFALELGCVGYCEVSSKTGHNVEELFVEVVREHRRRTPNEPRRQALQRRHDHTEGLKGLLPWKAIERRMIEAELKKLRVDAPSVPAPFSNAPAVPLMASERKKYAPPSPLIVKISSAVFADLGAFFETRNEPAVRKIADLRVVVVSPSGVEVHVMNVHGIVMGLRVESVATKLRAHYSKEKASGDACTLSLESTVEAVKEAVRFCYYDALSNDLNEKQTLEELVSIARQMDFGRLEEVAKARIDSKVRSAMTESHVVAAEMKSALQSFDFLCDVELVVRDTHKKLHRALLMARSAWFKVALGGSYKEAASGLLDLSDTLKSGECLFLLAEYLYTGSIKSLSPEHAIELLAVGDFMQLKRLTQLAEIAIVPDLTMENCVSYYRAAQHYNAPQLREAALYLMAVELESVPALQSHPNVKSRDELLSVEERDELAKVVKRVEEEAAKRKRQSSIFCLLAALPLS